MTQQHLLSLSQNEGVENNFGQHILFRYLDFVCKPIAVESKGFAIKTGELFYHCVYSMDTLKGISSYELQEKCNMLWFGMAEHMNKKSFSTDDADVIHAISLVVYSVERCLLLTNDPIYSYPAGILQSIIQRYDSVYANQLQLGFNRAEQVIGSMCIGKWLSEYMYTPTYLSDEIETIIDLSRDNHAILGDRPTQKELEAVFTTKYLHTDDSHRLVEFLRGERETASDGDWARYALAIYRHKKIFIERPGSFKKWLSQYCTMFGRDVAYQDPNKLSRTKCSRNIGAYFPTE